MTDAAAIAVSSRANDLRLSISTSDIENVTTHEDRGSDPIIAECIDTDISVETLALRRATAREAGAPALASPKTREAAAGDGAITATSNLGERTFAPWMTVLLATACGLTAANLYYAQPLAGPISVSLALSARATGLIVTLTQVGYGAGLLFIVPLTDLVENRRLVLVMLAVCVLALLGAALSSSASLFLTAALFVGFASVVVQMLVPYAAHMASDAERGRVVGNVMSGTLLGIMLARPISSFVAHIYSWHAGCFLSARATTVLALALSRTLTT